MEHVREMQEKLARLHFDLNAEVDDMPVDQRKLACDTNMDKLLLNVRANNLFVKLFIIVVSLKSGEFIPKCLERNIRNRIS